MVAGASRPRFIDFYYVPCMHDPCTVLDFFTFEGGRGRGAVVEGTSCATLAIFLETGRISTGS